MENYKLAIPKKMFDDLSRAAELRGQTFNDIIIKVLADSNKWQAKGCRAGNCTAPSEMEAGGRMGYCPRHYKEQYGTHHRACADLLSDEWRDK